MAVEHILFKNSNLASLEKGSELESNFNFKIRKNDIEKIQKYRYLGVELNYSWNFTHTVDILANASSHSLGNLVHEHYTVK